MYDVIIIGNGPAGISAAIYAKRANLKVLLLAKGKSALEKAEKIENYYGFEFPISGEELLENGVKQAKRIGIEMQEKEVIHIKWLENEFEVITANQSYEENYTAKTIILATGSSRNTPNIKGIREFEGRGVSYCAVCDAFFYRNKKVAVLGNGNYAIGEALELLPVVNSVTMITNGEKPVENRDGILVNEKKIHEFRGENKIQEVAFEDNSTEKIDGVFIALGTASSTDLARKIGAKIENNKIIVDENQQTTVPNLYACGDCTPGTMQIAKAVYEGMIAALAIIKQIRKG